MARVPEPRELALIDQASRMLGEANSLEEIKAIRDKSESLRIYARTAKLGLELQNRAAELKLRAERKAGSFLAALQLRGGNRRSKSHAGTLNLKELGISRNESQRWQLQASVSEREFEKYIQGSNKLCKEISAAGLRRLAKSLQPETGSTSSCIESSVRGWQKGEIESCRESLVQELRDHHTVVLSLLEPLLDQNESLMTTGDRRHLKRLLSEMQALLEQLTME